ncbi:carboxypeptidase-like regulatory domain-containing protein [Rhodopirellula bahusiensis]|uniref:Nickel uptake substrate-specific transmembrane region n=1 Tax=Rhodopirellula bahusiensis TaxID=2014065 RepID=A0A2G1W697_9BACT|nr:carboxypeptidase-like regulatory domain-containing protein [Rhodopirellula bahusiensis]PHQ34350.1 hypothetical protein CEE69_15130 [Rhodopirellula bahusiensis]
MTSWTLAAKRWSFAAFLMLAVVSLDSVGADENANQPGTEVQAFELQVVDLDGNVVPNASIEIRCRPRMAATDIVVGAFEKKGTYGVMVNADSNGVLRLQKKQFPKNISFSIVTEGFAPYWLALDQNKNAMPDSATAKIEPAWAVGGVVLDPGGRPIENAEVHPSLPFRMSPTATRSLHVGTSIKTDANGRWRYGHVPISKRDVTVAINHPQFGPLRTNLSRSEFESTAEQPSSGSVTLTQGLTLAGFVRDPEGNPIEDATVRTKFLNELREAKTDEFGRYQLTGCEQMHCRVVVFAKERALDMKEVHVRPGMEPVDFVLPPGGRVKVRVVDADGNGLPKTRIFLQRWRGRVGYFEFDHVDCYTDENGVWEWNEAPLDVFEADICPPGGMQLARQPIVAGDAEHLFQPPPLLVITGKVRDAESGEPITGFRVTPGHRNDNPSIGFDWYKREAYTSNSADYQVEFNRSGSGYVVRIEADGYRVAQSRDFQFDEGDVTFDFQMEPAESITGQIVDANGQPAAHAGLAISNHGAQISIQDGMFRDSSTYATRLAADIDGRFSLPVRDDPFHVVVIHDQGHAFLYSESIQADAPIELQPWSSLEGTYRIGAKPAANTRLTIFGGEFRSDHRNTGRVHASATTVTDGQGRYRHHRLFDGRGSISREIIMMVDDGAEEITSTPRVPFIIGAGENLELDLGGSGRSAIGQLQAPLNYPEPIIWSLATVHVNVRLTPPTPLVDRAKLQQKPGQWEAWLKTPPGLEYLASAEAYNRERSSATRFFATVGADGLFRIDDIPAGEYELRADLGQGQNGSIHGHKLSIPSSGESESRELVDLGIIQLE